nr:transposase [uncultured Blautia sp.]
MPKKASGEPKVKRVERPQSNGDIYIYEVTTLYNPEKRYNEHVSSKLLGKKSPDGTEILPTRPRKAPRTNKTAAVRKTVGAMDILEWIGRESGIDDDILSSADIGTAQKVISIARFWMANPDKSVRRIEEWQISHTLPYREGISEDACYSLMKDLGQDISVSQKYFQHRASHAASRASVAVDSTTISSYSEYLNDVRFGYNKDGNGLATVKMLTLFCLNDHQPIAFSRQPGNIPDVISVLNALKQLSVLGMDKPLLVLDGGFFSEDNILAFVHAHTKFLMRGQLDGKWIFPELQAIASRIERPSNAWQDSPDMYCMTRRISHQFTYERQRTRGGVAKGSITVEEHRLYLHFILDTGKARLNTALLMKEIQHVKQQLTNGVDLSLLTKSERRNADRFLIQKTIRGRLTVTLNDKAIIDETRYYGYFVLVSNEKMDAFRALREYRLRELTEEGFRIDKQYNDAHVTRSKTTGTLEGRFFCQFVAYGYEVFFQRELNRLKSSLAVPTGDPSHDNSETFKKEKALLNWLKGMSVAKLFDWFDAIQETTVNTNIGKARWKTETIERDRLFLTKLGVLKADY